MKWHLNTRMLHATRRCASEICSDFSPRILSEILSFRCQRNPRMCIRFMNDDDQQCARLARSVCSTMACYDEIEQAHTVRTRENTSTLMYVYHVESKSKEMMGNLVLPKSHNCQRTNTARGKAALRVKPTQNQLP